MRSTKLTLARPAALVGEPIRARRDIRYGETLAASLILYAREHDAFAERLEKLIDAATQDISSVASIETQLLAADAFRSMHIRNEVEALARAEWFIAAARDGRIAGGNEGIAMLYQWVKKKDDPEPKIIVIGHILGFIPPVGAGNVKRKKKMTLIISDETSTEKDHAIHAGAYAVRMSFELFHTALVLAGGSLRKLEPEMAEWFFDGRELALYRSSRMTMRTISAELRTLDIPHTLSTEDGRPAILAITPALDTTQSELGWNITAVI